MISIQQAVKTNHGKNPEKILQFGEGNFLRAFADWMIDDLNEKGLYDGSIVICQPIPGNERIRDIINRQDGDYTVIMRGIASGAASEERKVITSVSRCINAYDDYDELTALFCSEDLEVVISNTTEAGITYGSGEEFYRRPADTFPAKLTQLLYDRYEKFGGKGHGLLFLPVELIDDNGYELRRIILQHAREWQLGENFCRWIEEENMFTSTLVDRIVTGYPAREAEALCESMGYADEAMVTCERFSLWVIEGQREWKESLPLGDGEGNVIWTDDVRPYKMRKVRILNGAHTATVLAGALCGYELVIELVENKAFRAFLDKLLLDEVIPQISLPEHELKEFAGDVMERFRNPYIRHRLLDIALNSCSKYAARCLPSLLDYERCNNSLPECLVMSLAALIRFYKGTPEGSVMIGTREDGEHYQIRDSRENCEFFADAWRELECTGDMDTFVSNILREESIWGTDLTKIGSLAEMIKDYLERMEREPLEDMIWETASSGSMKEIM